MKRPLVATAVGALVLLGTAAPAFASEAHLTITADCSGLVTATASVVSADGTTGAITDWWADASGNPASANPVTVKAPNGATVRIGVNMLLSTGASSSDDRTIVVPAPCGEDTTTTTEAPTTTTTTIVETTVPTTEAPTTTSTAADTAESTTTRPTVPGFRERPTTTNEYANCPPDAPLVTGAERQPGDLPIWGSPWYCRPTLPRTGAGETRTMAILGGGLVLAGGLLLAARRRMGGAR